MGLRPPGAHAFSHCLSGCVATSRLSFLSWKGLHREKSPVLTELVVREASGVPGSLDLPDFANLVTYLSCRVGGGSCPLQVGFFSSGLLAGFAGHVLHVYSCGVISLQNCMEGESEIWLQKVIWQFIFRTALLPAACFKLNPWHQDIHHFNCMRLFSQAQICFFFFLLSPVVWGVLCFLFSPWSTI